MKVYPLAPIAPLAKKALHLSTHCKVIEAPGAAGLYAVQVFSRDGRPGLLFGTDGYLWLFDSAPYAQSCIWHAHEAATVLPEDRVD